MFDPSCKLHNNQSPSFCILFGHSTPPGVHAPPFSWCAHAAWCLHALGLLVSAHLLMPTRLGVPSLRTPPSAYSSRLLVFARLDFPTVHTAPGVHKPLTPSGVHAPPFSWCAHTSWCLHASGLLLFASLLLFACIRFAGVHTPPGVGPPRPPAVHTLLFSWCLYTSWYFKPLNVYTPLGDCTPPGVRTSAIAA